MRRTLLPLAILALGQAFPAWASADDDPLAELEQLAIQVAANGTQAGGSIRAKLRVDVSQAERSRDPHNFEAIVTEVLQGSRPPLAAVRVKVLRPAQTGEAQTLVRNASLTLRPQLKVVNQQVDLRDLNTQVNAGAYYLRIGDRVAVRLGEGKGNLWQAAYLERL